jgi:multidrug transporter EmrE-like cation transporter
MKSDFLGAVIAIFSAVASNFGVNMQKYSHNKEELRAKPRPYHLRPIWWFGMICVVFGSLGDFFALGFASQTLVASLGGGSTIFVNVMFAKFWLKQSLYITDVIGVAMVTVGVVVLAAASSDEGEYKMEQIYHLMQAAPFILYCFVTTAFVMTLFMRVRRSKAPALRVGKESTEIQSGAVVLDHNGEQSTIWNKESPSKKNAKEVTAGVGDKEPISNNSDYIQANVKPVCRSALMSPFPSPVHDLSPRRLAGEEDDNLDGDEDEIKSFAINATALSRKKLLFEGKIEKHILIIDPKLPLYWAAISGTIGAQSVLLAKCVMEMIFASISGDNQFIYFGTYVLIGGMVATLLTQTHALNMATMCGDTMSTFPVFQAFWIGMSNISGIIFFQQAHNFNRTQWMMFPSALVLVLMGIYLISKHEKFGNNVQYSVALPISLSSPRQHDIVAQSFEFRVLTPQRIQEEDFDDQHSTTSSSSSSSGLSPRRSRRGVLTV